MKVPPHSSLIQSIVSLQDLAKANQPSQTRGDRPAFPAQGSGPSNDIGVDAGGRSSKGRAARPQRAEASGTGLQTSDAQTGGQGQAVRASQREVPNTTMRGDRNQPLGQYVNILV